MPFPACGFSPGYQLEENVVENREHTEKVPRKCRKYKNKENVKKSKTPQNCTVKMLSANAAGCANKMQSLVDNVKNIDAAIITLQETHFNKKGKMNEKFPDFEVFEAIRDKVKGGTAVIVHKSLKPVLIEEYSTEFELIVVEVKIGDIEVRLIVGYGPQENLRKEERMLFFAKLEDEVQKAKISDKAIIIQMDANSKLGPQIIKGDPHSQTDNGKILSEVINRNALVVMNSVQEKCTGVITRKRSTGIINEESVIDFVIACEEMADMIEHVEIDEDKKYVLARYTKTKKGYKTQESDHNTIITSLKANWYKDKVEKRKESYNYKKKESLIKFQKLTSEGRFLSEVFDNENKDIEVTTKQFLKRLKYCITQCFDKIRVKGPRVDKKLEELFDKRRRLKTKDDETSIKELEEVEELLAERCAEQNLKIVEEAFEELSCEDGGVNVNKMWKMKKKLKGVYCEPPTAIMDKHGNLITDSKGIEKVVIERYKERLSPLPIKPELQLHKEQREDLCNQRLQQAQKNKTPDWTEKELERVLKQLKTHKSKDPLDMPNELFKPENIGSDLKIAVLKLMNRMKKQQKVPSHLKYCNITSLYKNKGSKKDFENYRGIFRVVTLRSIMDKLIYNDLYPVIDAQLTDSNVGARQNRNIRDNIFVINAVTHEVIKKKKEGVDIQVFDAYKCFDKLWSKECFNDVYECGFTDDKLPLLFSENMNAQVAVKTATGTTERTSISEVVMQGTVWGSLMCTSTMDKLGKLAYQMPHNLYKYKEVPIPPLGMVDDIICVSSVENTTIMNKLINTFIEKKNLKLSETKCGRIHIGKGHENCPNLKVHEHNMKDSDKEKYLGDTIDKSGKIKATIEDRKQRGQGAISEIVAILEEIPFGKYRTEVAMKLREAMFLNRMLFNSEAWHGVTKTDIATLEMVDKALLRAILNAHRGTTTELLYLETGAIPIKWIIPQRRIMYLKHIMSRKENELIQKVYLAQKEHPSQGDFAKLVAKDLEQFGLTHDEVEADTMSKEALKKELKETAKKEAFAELYTGLQKGTKGKDLRYNRVEIQDYLKSDVTKNEKSMLTAMRTRCVKTLKANFPRMHNVCKHCPLGCDIALPQEDTQEHILICPSLGEASNVEYDFIHAGVVEQALLVKEFIKRMETRTQLLEGLEDPSCCHLPGVART